jgi:uncharacterized protein (TIGR02147 family)
MSKTLPIAAPLNMERVVVAVLLSSKTSSEALKRLYQEQKLTDSPLTLQVLCDKAGMPSTGYLSDVLSGRRTLHPKYRRGIAKAFALTGPAARALSAQVLLDHEKDQECRRKLTARLARLHKALRIDRQNPPSKIRDFFFAGEVFCAFGLYRNKPSVKDLLGYFGSERERDVHAALATLERLGAARLEEDETYTTLHPGVIFGEETNGAAHINFLKLALNDAVANVERWFPAKDRSHFGSSIISVRAADYEAKLRRIKTDLLVAQADLESGDADLLIHFNVQIYPVSSP